MEVMCSSETSVDFQRTTRRYIPDDRGIYNYRRENLISWSLRCFVYKKNNCLLYEWNSGVTKVIRYTVRVKSVPLHDDVLNAFLKIVFCNFSRNVFKWRYNVLQWTLNPCKYLSHCVSEIEFSVDEGVPFAVGTLIKWILCRWGCAFFRWNTTEVNLM
jgi:hypothetical protein